MAAAIVFIWWSLQGEWAAVRVAVGQVSALRLMASFALVLSGLACTVIVWHRILVRYGHKLTLSSGFSVFFIGQLGKYIPGAIWSLAAQGEMARRFNIPVRTTVATGLMFIYWNVTTATLLSSVLAWRTSVSVGFPGWANISIAMAAVAAMTPAAVTVLANKIAGTENPQHTRLRDTLLFALLMLLTWAAYGAAMTLVASQGEIISSPDLNVSYAVFVFAIAYVLGVLVPFAPAGFGIREATLAIFLAPALGVAAAAAIAILTRAIHTIADVVMAVIAWSTTRHARN